MLHIICARAFLGVYNHVRLMWTAQSADDMTRLHRLRAFFPMGSPPLTLVSAAEMPHGRDLRPIISLFVEGNVCGSCGPTACAASHSTGETPNCYLGYARSVVHD